MMYILDGQILQVHMEVQMLEDMQEVQKMDVHTVYVVNKDVLVKVHMVYVMEVHMEVVVMVEDIAKVPMEDTASK